MNELFTAITALKDEWLNKGNASLSGALAHDDDDDDDDEIRNEFKYNYVNTLSKFPSIKVLLSLLAGPVSPSAARPWSVMPFTLPELEANAHRGQRCLPDPVVDLAVKALIFVLKAAKNANALILAFLLVVHSSDSDEYVLTAKHSSVGKVALRTKLQRR